MSFERLWHLTVALILAALVASGCAGEPTRSTVINRTTISAAAATPIPTRAAPAAAPTAASSVSTDLPGEPFALAPAAGTSLAVVGVEGGSFLNVRALPGTDNEIVSTVASTAGNLIASGRARILGGATGSVWVEVTTDGTTGWASSQFLSSVGRTAPGTSQFLNLDDAFEGPFQVVDHIRANALGLSEGQLKVVIVDGPTVSGSSEIIVVDILGFADDSLLGNRLRVIGEAGPRGSFVVAGIETTVLCRRGVSADSLCV